MLFRNLLICGKKFILINKLVNNSKNCRNLLVTKCCQLRHFCSKTSSLPISDNSIEDKPEFPGSRSKWIQNLGNISIIYVSISYLTTIYFN